ncbi:MAG: hypothetical protein Q4F66_12210, partial [Clostridium sp.]|nr:hypothetical protein [Clostridium sp.]
MKISITDNNKNIYEDFIDVTPVLTKKILDCVNVKIERYEDINDVVFTLADLGIDYIDNALVSLEQISYSYDFLGLRNNPIKGRIGNCEIDLYGVHGMITDSGT